MDFQQILYDVADGIATITLNRPERLNAFTPVMIDDWARAIELARNDDAVRAVLVTGQGRAFCAGGDVGSERAETSVLRTSLGPADRRNNLRYSVHRVARALWLLDKPYIAVVNGAAVGAGMDMASMADMRFFSDTARVGMAYVKVGIIPGDGGAYFLPRIVGVAKALDLIWTGDLIDAEEALRIGYATRVYPADSLLAETRAYAAKLAEGPAVAMQLAKRLLYRSLDVSMDAALDLAQSAMVIAQSTEDAKEGPKAFAEKRPPQFQGR
ncbi:MAG: enoyl-CoA hydratase/isomerase family protein [Dehalococcoidia bacterium]